MILLHIEHTVTDFEQWKAGFDSFAELRQQTGVRRFQVSRLLDRPDFVMIDLEFDSVQQAQTLLGAVQSVWQRVNGTLINDPQWRLSAVVETRELQF